MATLFDNWRFSPFTGVTNSVEIDDEPHTIEFHDDWNGYGIQLHEGPVLDSPSTVSIVEDVTGGSTFAEVPRTQSPGIGEFRVDYDADTYFGTGRIEFNAADNAKDVLVTYEGNGYVVKNVYRLGQTTIPTELNVSGNTDIDGDLNVDGEITGDLTGDLTGDVTGDVTGNVTGNVTGDLTGDVDAAIVDISGSLKHSGAFSFGYLDDGTPLFSKWLTGSIAAIDLSTVIAHGISNAYTQKKIYSITAHFDDGDMKQISSTVSGFAPLLTLYSDTNITVERSNSTPSALDVYIFVIYK